MNKRSETAHKVTLGHIAKYLPPGARLVVGRIPGQQDTLLSIGFNDETASQWPVVPHFNVYLSRANARAENGEDVMRLERVFFRSDLAELNIPVIAVVEELVQTTLTVEEVEFLDLSLNTWLAIHESDAIDRAIRADVARARADTAAVDRAIRAAADVARARADTAAAPTPNMGDDLDAFITYRKSNHIVGQVTQTAEIRFSSPSITLAGKTFKSFVRFVDCTPEQEVQIRRDNRFESNFVFVRSIDRGCTLGSFDVSKSRNNPYSKNGNYGS
jgi:hypothetical protein